MTDDLFSIRNETLSPLERRDADHLAFVATLPCVRCYVQFRLTTHAVAVVPVAGACGMPPDARWSLPLCDIHRPAGDDRLYWARLGVDPETLCTALYECRGDRAAAATAYRRAANYARLLPPETPFKLLHPQSEEAMKIAAQFRREEAVRV